jgi:hypothetical protein
MTPTPLDKLVALAATQIAQIHAAPGSAAWVRAMEAALVKAHTAAGMVGIAQRTGVDPRGLSKAERGDIKRAVAEQLPYLRRFAAEAGDMSEGAVAARAALYAGAIKPTYYEARWGTWDIPPDLMPGRQQCLGNCKCSVAVADNGDGTGTLTRTMGGVEHHCTECPPLVGDHSVKRRAA